MKAKEYAEMYNNHEDKKEILGKILKLFLKEIESLRILRKAQTDSAIKAIIRELSQKWDSFSNKVEGVDPKGFIKFLKYELENRDYPTNILDY